MDGATTELCSRDRSRDGLQVHEDPTEIACWLAAVSLSNRKRAASQASPMFLTFTWATVPPWWSARTSIPLGKAAWARSRERSLTPACWTPRYPRSHRESHYPSMLRSRRWRVQGLYGPLRSIGRAIYALESVGALPTDLRPENLGRRKRDDSLVLHDPGPNSGRDDHCRFMARD